MTTIMLIVAANWLVPLVVTWLYVGWLWLLSGDIKLVGWVLWAKAIPVARFRLISRRSWYAQAWQGWYGFAMMLAIIHRDEKGSLDDDQVEVTIVHEMRHIAQIMVLGLLHWILYAAHTGYLMARGKPPHAYNWFENDARAAAARWIEKGRPRTYKFGKRQ